MSIEEYNEELTKIKQFHTYLTSILDTGYMNEIEDLKSLTKQLDNINIISTNNQENYNNQEDYDSDYDCIPFIRGNKYNTSSVSSSNNVSSSEASTETEDESHDEETNIDKEQEKVNRFINAGLNNDIFQLCGNISLYKANGFDYIDNMKKFIKESFIY
jgi:hypothetical protein